LVLNLRAILLLDFSQDITVYLKPRGTKNKKMVSLNYLVISKA